MSPRLLFTGLASILLALTGLPANAQDTSRTATPRPSPAHPRVPLSPLSDPFPYGAYEHSIEFDTASSSVLLREELFGNPFGQTRAMSLDEYIMLRQEEERRRMWEEKATTYALTAPEEADSGLTSGALLDSLLKGGTSIKIPIPDNPLSGLFGTPTVNINVNGSVNVSAGWQWDNNNLTSISSLGSTQSAPFFDQNIQVSVTGSIGEKLKLSTDFDTQRTFDIDNQMKISFGGQNKESDDDIIQSVEAGNVSLETPSTLIGGSQALFGVKMKTKFGRLLLTSLASQKRGERKTVSVNGGSVVNAITLKPFEYAQNHFWLDTLYKTFYDEFYRNNPPSATPRMAQFNIVEIEVYEQVKDGSVPAQFEAVAYADLPSISASTRYDDTFRTPPTNLGSGAVQQGSFIRLEEGRGYEIDRQLGVVTIRSLQRDKLYAVAYRTSNGQAHGELSNTRPDSTIKAVLKLIYVNNMQPSFRTLWARQMKNIYQLGVRNVDLQNSRIRITYGVPPDTSEVFRVDGGKRIVTVLGVDRTNSSNEPVADGVFDIQNPAFFDPATGEIIFPSTEPFRKQLREQLGPNAEQFVLDAIYDQTRDEAQRDTRIGKYTIAGEIAGSGGGRIALNAFNFNPESVRVIANGELLTQGVDYTIDQFLGEVKLISPRANNAAGNLVVEYEQNDIFNASVRTLVGLRADYDLYNKRRVKSRLGATFMRYAQSLPIDKIQIYSGEEPVLNTAIGLDGFVDYEAPFLTDFVDALPFIKTDVPSSLSFGGEIAWMLPDAGTIENLIDIDEGQSVAYVDDFESGAKRQIPLGINYTLWHHASPPIDAAIGGDDTGRVNNKGHFWWYNRSPPIVPTLDIWPNRGVAFTSTSNTTTVLDILFDPTKRGIYNPNMRYEAAPPLDQAWGGMMRSLSFFVTNLNEENIDFVEIALKIENPETLDPNTKVYLDLGQISEDLIPNFNLNTEDGVTPENPQRDDVLNQGEDIGIDGLNNDAERIASGVNEPDPARDDFAFDAFRSNNPDDYASVNGLEGNVGQESGPFPDAEDLNGNRGIDVDNSYFRYELSLNTDPATNPQIVGSGLNGWVHYRIPLRTGFSTVGSPSFSNVQYARVVIKSPKRVHLRVAEMNLVGSDWRNMDLPVGDSTQDPKLNISFVNLEDNGGAPDFYTLPPGVSRASNAGTDYVLQNEQSLALEVRDLQRGETRGAMRVHPRAFDAFNYKSMRFFLHGSGELDDEYIPGQPAKVVAFVRFGWDSLNYYEYRVPLLRGWNGYDIDFDQLAAIKQDADPTSLGTFPIPDKPGHEFAVRGIPSITRVQFIAFGVSNNAWPGALNTTMWVNELRAVGAESGADWAATLQASAKLADLASINYNASRNNPDFHRLEERFGDRVERTNWAFNSIFNMEKFLPESMKGSQLPLTYNHVERIEKPRFIAQSDVNLNSAVSRIRENQTLPAAERQRRADSLTRATQTLVVQDAFALKNIAFRFPGSSWLIRDLANRFTFGFSYDQRRERSPVVEERFVWAWDFRGAYNVSIPQNFKWQPVRFLDSVPVLKFWKDFQINFLPTQFDVGVDLHRGRTTEKLRELPTPSPVIRDFRASRLAGFSWPLFRGGIINPTIDYRLTVGSSLTYLETDELGRQRSAGEIRDDLFLDEGRLFNFGLDNLMKQTFTFNTQPRIPFIPNIERYLTPSANYKVEYTWQDLLIPPTGLGSYTKSANYDARSTVGLGIRLKSIGDAIWGDQPARGPRGAADSARSESTIASILRYLIKVPLLDWGQLQFNFTQNNKAKNPGVLGGTGVTNLWGRSLLFRSESPDFGPGAAYQLGLTRYPHGRISLFGGEAERGLRAPDIYVQDNFNQENNLSANTSRELWPGATLTLNWTARWGFNQNYSVTTDAVGIPTYDDYLTTGTLSRSYLSLPLFFDNDIEGVVDEYAARKALIAEPTNPGPGATPDQIDAYNRAFVAYNKEITAALSETFEEQLEAFAWMPATLASFFPRANWRFQWNGLEKLPFVKNWAQSARLSHEYQSQFNRNFRETDEGRVPETQTVSREFRPLVGINVTGKPDFWKGTASASLQFNTTSRFGLVTAARSEISKELQNEVQLRVGYQRRGLKLSLFGLDLKNEIEFATDFSYARQNRKRFNLTDFRPEGNNDGSTRISLRPSVRYTISRTVDITGFVSYEATIPDDEGSRDISRSTTKVGLDIRMKISGGR